MCSVPTTLVSFTHPHCSLFCVIGEDQICTCPLEARESFHYDRTFVYPAVLCRRLDHGVLTAHVVCSHRQGRVFPKEPDHVQVRHPWLHHDDVGAFRFIRLQLSEGLAKVTGVHLVRALVPRNLPRLATGSRGTFQGVPEGSVEGAGVFGAVGHDRHVLEPVCIEGRADGTHTAVHHVARGHAIRTRTCLGDSLGTQHCHRLVIQHFAHHVVDNAIVSVGRVRVQSHVSVHVYVVTIGLLEGPDAALGEAVGVGTLLPEAGLECIGCLREDDHLLYAVRHRLPRLCHELVHGVPLAARHGCDGCVQPGLTVNVVHEQRVNKVRRHHRSCLAHGFAEHIRLAVPPRAVSQILSANILCGGSLGCS
mmetsp:Transcript_15697/g.40017  ORF Transcript_15697/g.40017 Transcript_15697/m.40017 type:complete len:364 (+) Transcript_15697:137-1228(+)